MATLDAINVAVLTFAKSTTLAVTPSNIMDPIVPALASMAAPVFNQFYFDLLNALTSSGITATVPMEGVKNATVWFHISTLTFHFQTSG